MTESQKALACFFADHSDRWMKTEEIIGAMTSPVYGVYPPVKNWNQLHDSTARRRLTQDIQEMNDSEEYDCIIIHGDRGYKIATMAEAAQYLLSQIVEAAKKMKRYHNLCRKAGIHGQIDMDGMVHVAFPERA